MVWGGLLSRGTLRLHLEQDRDEMFLHPPAPGDLMPSEDPVLSGEVVLTLEKAMELSAVVVKLKGQTELLWAPGDKSEGEKRTELEKELRIELDGMLEAGEHRWAFSFIVPSTTAPFQRTVYGHTRHYLTATGVVPGSLSANLTAKTKEVFFVVNNYTPGAPPDPFAITVQDVQDGLGAWGVTFASPHLSVGAPGFTEFTILHPPPGLQIVAVTARVVQNFFLHYSSGRMFRPPTQKHVFIDVTAGETTPSAAAVRSSSTKGIRRDDYGHNSPAPSPSLSQLPPSLVQATPLVQPMPGKQWFFRQVARLPNDDAIRPSTVAGTEAMLRVQHGLEGVIRYRLNGGEERRVELISKEVVILSCTCQSGDIVLPGYDEAGRTKFGARCQCLVPFEDLYDREFFAAWMERVETVYGSEREVSRGRKVGEDQAVVGDDLEL